MDVGQLLLRLWQASLVHLRALLTFLRTRSRPPPQRRADVDRYWAHVRGCSSYTQLLLRPESITALLGGLNPASSAALRAFAPVRQRTACTFARAARLWGADADDPRTPAAVTLFAAHAAGLDGFVVRATAPAPGVAGHARAVNAVLSALARANPRRRAYDCLECRRRVGRPGWVFDFAGEQFFVASFSNCYGERHSRHAYGAGGDRTTFVLLQPFTSFFLRGVGRETPASETEWDAPATVRDVIRCRYRSRGQGYHIPDDPVAFPNANGIVPPLHDVVLKRDNSIVRWWEMDDVDVDERKTAEVASG
jgi:hypothetical protein